jgi:hypothetical protein
MLPAFPVRVACEHMMKSQPRPEHGAGQVGSGGTLGMHGAHAAAGKGNMPMVSAAAASALANMRDAAGVLYNVTETESCFDIPEDPNYDGIWDYQWCAEMLPQETYFTLSGVKDMFWHKPMNMTAINAHCVNKYGFAPRADWIATEFGGAAGVAAASNIVFSNGLFDPWSSGGVNVTEAAAATDRVASVGVGGSVKAVVLDHGAHHLDLMFANKGDTPDVYVVLPLFLTFWFFMHHSFFYVEWVAV